MAVWQFVVAVAVLMGVVALWVRTELLRGDALAEVRRLRETVAILRAENENLHAPLMDYRRWSIVASGVLELNRYHPAGCDCSTPWCKQVQKVLMDYYNNLCGR